MKKQSFVLSVVLVWGVLLLAACSGGTKAMTPEAFGTAFMNEIFFNKTSKELESEIKNYKEFKSALDEQGDMFTEGMLSGVSQTGGEVSEEEGQKVYQSLAKQVQDNAKFTVKSAKDDGKKRTIVYEITGLDGAGMMKGYMANIMTIVTEMSSDPTKYENANQEDVMNEMLPKIVTALDDAIKETKAAAAPVEVSLEFAKEDGRWNIATDDANLSSLYAAFFFGVDDASEVTNLMMDAYSATE